MPLSSRRISVDEAARHEMSGGKRRVGSGEGGFIAVERAVLVAARNARPLKQSDDSQLLPAIAGLGGGPAIGLANDTHSHSVAFGAELRHERVSEKSIAAHRILLAGGKSGTCVRTV